VWVPDRFWGGIVGAFLASAIGAVAFGFVVSGFAFPGLHDTTLLTALEAIPGTLIGLAICYWIGVRRGNQPVIH